MKEKEQTIQSLLEVFFEHLRKLQRSEKTMEMYQWRFRKLKVYMDLNCLPLYDEDVGKKYIASVLGSFNYSQLSDSKKVFVNAIGTLSEFQKTGAIQLGIGKHPPKVFNGQLGRTMTEFVASRKAMFNLSDNTLIHYNSFLSDLLVFLNKEGVVSSDQITLPVILRYISGLDPGINSRRDRILQYIKNYLRHLYEQKHLPADYSGFIPKGKTISQARLPSTFSVDEIKLLLKAVDRASAKGKRDYAILLLAVKLGMRSSDIRWLKFEHLLWQQQMIRFNQQKTGKSMTLPLLPEIGNAIIDYLQYGRPASSGSYLFVNVRSPYEHIGRTTIGQLVYFHLRRAGINCSNRKHGPHTLRHSFAENQLNKKIPLPVISQTLGHSHIGSTMNYLRIDIAHLRQCTLDVPPVPSSFYYNQKGGLYHG